MATRQEVATILTAINSIKADVHTLSLNLRSVELRVSNIETAACTPPTSPSASTDQSDGGISLSTTTGNKPVEPVITATPRKNGTGVVALQLSAANTSIQSPKTARKSVTTIAEAHSILATACQRASDPPVRSSELQQQLQPIANGIGSLTQCVLGIEKVLAKLSSAYDNSLIVFPPGKDHQHPSFHIAEDTPSEASDRATRASSACPTPPTTESSGLRSTFSTPRDRRRDSVTDPGDHSTDMGFSQCAQGTPPPKRSASCSPGKQRRVTNTGLPDHSRSVIFGQPSTPITPLKHRLTINVDASPYGKYDAERSPFSQLSKGHARLNGRRNSVTNVGMNGGVSVENTASRVV